MISMAKVMISLPDDLLERLDREAARQSTTRSGLLQTILRERLVRPNLAARRRAVDALRKSLRGGDWNAEDLIRAERER